MNINFFFIFIFVGLISIYNFFIPIKIVQQEFVDVPLFEINNFTLYELNNFGLVTLMSGKNSTRYSDRYTVSKINFTDNSNQYIINMIAEKGIYKNNKIALTENIVFSRADGLSFKTSSAEYNKNTNIITTDEKYILVKDTHSIAGDSLRYFNLLNKIESSNVIVKYQLGE